MTSHRTINAVIWDMDGMIFDTERLSFVAWQAGATQIGKEIDLELFRSLIGMNSQSIQRRLQETLGGDCDVAELTHHAGLEYDRLIEAGPPLKAGAKECLHWLADNSIPQALATSSSMKYAARKLDFYGLKERFQTLVTGDQVSQGKPHPEPYLLAASRLGIDPKHCLAFEDSVNGIKAAHDAGMSTALVFDMCPHDEASLARVDLTFDSLLEALPYLQNLFKASA